MLTRVLALTRFRVVAYLRLQRALAPLVAAFVAVSIAYAGGVAPANQAYAFSATLLFGIFGWQTKLVLDAEATGQRLLARVSVGNAGADVAADLLAAGVAAIPVVLLGVGAPLALGTLKVDGPLLPWIGFGAWLHVLSAVAGTGVGVVASRAVVPRAGWSTLLLVMAPVAVLVLGSRESAIPRWLVPQLFASARIEHAGDVARIGLVSAHTILWAAVLLAAYAALRRTRA